MENLFLAQAQAGKNAWWRYLVGILLILLVWQVGAGLFILPILAQNNGKMPQEPSPVNFLLMLAGFGFLLGGTWVINRWLHGRSVKSLTTPFQRVNWKRILLGAGLWLVIMSIVSITEALLYPGRYTLNPNPVGVLPYFLIALVFIPLQTSAEEYFFRGYLLQASGRLLRQPVLLAIINGVLFAIPHLANPEAGAMGFIISMLMYGFFGFFFAYITLRTQTLELALGIHAANNFFTGILANYKTTALNTASLFVIQTLDPVFGLVSLLVAIGVVLGLLSTPWMKNVLFTETEQAALV